MKIQNLFNVGIIDKDSQGRFVAEGKLIDAENFFVNTLEGSGGGVGKNALGNALKTAYNITGGHTIGHGVNSSANKVYNFIKGTNHDYIIEYDSETFASAIVAQSTTGTRLNFRTGERITNVDVIVSGDENETLLAFSGDSNQPRILNISRFKARHLSLGIDWFTEAEIMVIKAPPVYGVDIYPKQTSLASGSNFMENKIFSFAYRYKYNDNYYSPFSSWSKYSFVPSGFNIDLESFDNNGMVNSANAVELRFNTGSRDVIGIDLLFKESNSDDVYIINRFEKSKEIPFPWGDNAIKSFEFNNSKVYMALPKDEYYRNDDKVPLSAKGQANIGNRLAYANYVEGRDIPDKIDFTVGLSSVNFTNSTIPDVISNNIYPFALSNKVDFETFTGASGGMNFATNVLTKSMAIGSTLKLDFEIDPSNETSSTKYNLYLLNGSTVIYSELDKFGTHTYTHTISAGGVILDVALSYFVTTSTGLFYYATLTETYNTGSPEVTVIEAKFQESYQKSTAYDATYTGDTVVKSKFTLSFSGQTFNKGKSIIINYVFASNLMGSSTNEINGTFFYTLLDDYTNLNDFYTNSDFKTSLEGAYSASFIEANGSGTVSSSIGFVTSISGNILTIQNPYIQHLYTDVATSTDYNTDEFFTIKEIEGSFIEEGFFSSMHSNRDYEVAMIYRDGEVRKTTALVSDFNSIHIPQANSVTQNKLIVSVNHNPPSWAKTYKFAIKQTKWKYEILYGKTFVKDGAYVWLKLEGRNKNKVNEGDVLIVKRDTVGPITSKVIKTKILELKIQEKDFLSSNKDDQGNDVIEEAGLYIKIKPTDFVIDYSAREFLQLKEGAGTETDRPFIRLGAEDASVDTSTIAGVPATIRGRSRMKHNNGLSYMDSLGVIVDKDFPQGTTISLSLTSRAKGNSRTFKKTYVASISYANFEDFFTAIILPDMPLSTEGSEKYTNVSVVRGFWYGFGGISFGFEPNPSGYLFLQAEGIYAGHPVVSGWIKGKSGYIDGALDVRFSDSLVIFETEPEELINTPYFETPEVYTITGGAHEMTNHILTQASNCFCFGNGAESYQIKDGFNEKYISIDFSPTAVSQEKYKQVNRFADITYSGVYNSNTNINGLNSFNVYLANFKEDIDKSYGPIVKIKGTDTNLEVYQEDKCSKVYYEKDVLYNADGSSNLTKIESVLGQQEMYGGEYGISYHPESFDEYAFNSYLTDTKRGIVLKKSNNGLFEISSQGMNSYFKKLFRDNVIDQIIGEYDQHHDVFVLNIKYNSGSYVTWIYSDKDNGWLGRITFNPEDMCRVNGKFLSFYEGEIYEHNQATGRNTFYGEPTYESKFTINFPQEPSMRKNYKTIEIEGTDAWDLTINTDFDAGYVNASDFNKEEGVFKVHTRLSNTVIDTSLLSVQGIGNCTVAGLVLSFGFDLSSDVSIGDDVRNLDNELVGTILSKTPNSLTLNAVANIVSGDFVMLSKPQSANVNSLLGYHLQVSGTLTKNTKTELFAVNAEVVKSFN